MSWLMHQLVAYQRDAALVWLALLHSNAVVHVWANMRSGV